MAVSVSRLNVLNLYRRMMRESQKFSEFNYREYARRRIRDGFKSSKQITDKSQIDALIKSAESNLKIIQRQATISSLYKETTLVIEKPKQTTL